MLEQIIGSHIDLDCSVDRGDSRSGPSDGLDSRSIPLIVGTAVPGSALYLVEAPDKPTSSGIESLRPARAVDLVPACDRTKSVPSALSCCDTNSLLEEI